MTALHGWNSVYLAFALTTAGLLFGLIVSRARLKQILSSLLLTIPLLIVVALLWNLILWLAPVHLGDRLTTLLAVPFFLLCGALAGKWLAGRDASDPDHKRGTILGTAAPQPLKSFGRNGLTLAGFPIAPADETKHFKLIGTTGTGKSTAIREILEGALERGDRAVIADPDFSYVDRFYDRSRGDVILTSFDGRAARWDLFAEMSTTHDADQLARSLIADTEGTERPWRNYARVFLTSLLRQLHRVKHDDVGELYQLLSTTPVEDLRDLLQDTPAGPYLSQDNGKFFGAVRAVANTHLGALEHVALQSARDRLSVRHWIRNRDRSGVLFLPYRANEIATLRGLISTRMRLAIFEAMSQKEGDQKLWFAIDELDALGAIDGLKDALARLRKFGGRCILGFQSIGQVSTIYGQGEAQTIVENCGNTAIFRCSASEGGGTSRFASKLIGEREVIRQTTSTARGSASFFSNQPAHTTTTTSEHYATESAVLASEIEQLADGAGFVKFASRPEWIRVQFPDVVQPKVAPASVPR